MRTSQLLRTFPGVSLDNVCVSTAGNYLEDSSRASGCVVDVSDAMNDKLKNNNNKWIQISLEEGFIVERRYSRAFGDKIRLCFKQKISVNLCSRVYTSCLLHDALNRETPPLFYVSETQTAEKIRNPICGHFLEFKSENGFGEQKPDWMEVVCWALAEVSALLRDNIVTDFLYEWQKLCVLLFLSIYQQNRKWTWWKAPP